MSADPENTREESVVSIWERGAELAQRQDWEREQYARALTDWDEHWWSL